MKNRRHQRLLVDMIWSRVCSVWFAITCLCTCTRVDSSENTPPMPGAHRGRLDAAVKSNDSCVVCHDELANEWRGSMHRLANVDAAYRRAFAIEPQPFCRGCHAPEADPLVEPPDSVGHLGVGCVTCHVTEEGTVLAAPATNPEMAPHPVFRSQSFASTGGCSNCHEFTFPGIRATNHDGDEFFMQTTAREHARSPSANTPCADCHMPLVNGKRSHSFAQVREPEWLRKNIVISARRTDHDSLEVTLRQTHAGHGFPTGDLFRRLEVVAELRDSSGSAIRSDVRYLARHFVERPNGTGRLLQRDDRVFDAPVVLEMDIAPLEGPAASLKVFYSVKLQRVATVGDGLRPQDAVIESEVELEAGELPR